MWMGEGVLQSCEERESSDCSHETERLLENNECFKVSLSF